MPKQPKSRLQLSVINHRMLGLSLAKAIEARRNTDRSVIRVFMIGRTLAGRQNWGKMQLPVPLLRQDKS